MTVIKKLEARLEAMQPQPKSGEMSQDEINRCARAVRRLSLEDQAVFIRALGMLREAGTRNLLTIRDAYQILPVEFDDVWRKFWTAYDEEHP